jgi:hypothetical protein
MAFIQKMGCGFMKTWLIAIASLFLLFLVGCNDRKDSQVTAEEIRTMKEEFTSEISLLKKELIQVREERDQLASELQEQDSIKNHEDFNSRLMEAYRVQLLFTPPMNLPMYYSITPEPDFQDGWYVIKHPSTIRVNGYEDATSVRFMYTITGTDMEPQILYTDENPSDGWIFQWMSLPEGYEGIAFWTEVTWADGNVKKTPIMPIEVVVSSQ